MSKSREQVVGQIYFGVDTLLGAVAHLLRSYQQQWKDRTLSGTDSHVARFVIAAIGGGVVGLFITSGNSAASISPLAIAFLVACATVSSSRSSIRSCGPSTAAAPHPVAERRKARCSGGMPGAPPTRQSKIHRRMTTRSRLHC